MQKVNEVTYAIKSDKIKKNKVLALLSDFYYTGKEDIPALIALALNLSSLKPDVICITGDLFNNIQEIEENGEYLSFIEWVKIISKIAPVVIVKGDKDNLTYQNKMWQYYDSQNIFTKLADLPRVVVLDYPYSKIEINDLVLTGFSLEEKTLKYYVQDKESKLSYLENVRDKLNLIEAVLDPEQYNILLFHSPNNLFADFNHAKYSLFLAGHNLNGKVPNFVDTLTGNSTWGLINQRKELLAPFCRNCGALDEEKNLYGLVSAPAITHKKLVRSKPSVRYLILKSKR